MAHFAETTASESLEIATRSFRVALVGNPNTGKSTLFNALAGMNVRTGNYPGVTIEKKIGRCMFGDTSVELVDLPGTYSLAPRSPDEMVAVDVLTGDSADQSPVDLVVCVVNATLLQRNLFLVSQIVELGKPTIIALNMSDAAEARGLSINTDQLSENLGVRVVAISASKRTGLAELKSEMSTQLEQVANRQVSSLERDRPLPAEFYAVCNELRHALVERACTTESLTRQNCSRTMVPDQYLIERMLLDRGGEAERRAIRRLGAGVLPAIVSAREKLASVCGDPTELECSARYSWAAHSLEGVVSRTQAKPRNATDWLDAILTHRVGGMICFFLIMFGIFQCIYSLSSIPMDLIESLTGVLSQFVAGIIPPGMLRSLVVDGVIAGVGGVLIFLPQIALLFFFLAVLEDCGYMSRAAFLVDRVMTLFGLSGKSFLPLMSSFACAVPGVMATRVIENRRDRFATIMVAPLMSCSARLPVYLLLIGAFVPASGLLGGLISARPLVLMAMYFVGVFVAIPVAWILKKTLLRGETAPFVLELPEYKVPSARVVFSRVWEASREFVVRAGTMIFAASILIWFAGYWPGDHSRQFEIQTRIEQLEADSSDASVSVSGDLAQLRAEHRRLSSSLLENSTLGSIGHTIEPAVRPLGWDWRIGVGAVASFPAREVIIATLGTIYSLGGEVDEQDDGLIAAMRASKWPDGRPVFTTPVALSIMVFFALCAQCVSTLLVIKRETNSWFWPALSFTYMTALAYVGSLLTYQIGSRLF
ncbi:ferrous iron transport protein B [Novipirellula artificiosorum]|uniref:Ferrous iron transport protein B n=1 Tax=Novipirellula artificiosorum TaxID=2528016 RepID=A0A5C6DHD7_9BACT|nr:ferrous iron transport protein B [Novipirellula artificiosorum]TWU36068.1 Ferrous iron transport protein B [Novipirellula artificiosorum]